MTTPAPAEAPFMPLAGVRILSLALNLPGPAALMRCQRMGATCVKLEPPPTVAAAEQPVADQTSTNVKD